MDMYLDQGEPSEKCGDLNFGLEYDFATQTLKLKIIQVCNQIILIPITNIIIICHDDEMRNHE